MHITRDFPSPSDHGTEEDVQLQYPHHVHAGLRFARAELSSIKKNAPARFSLSSDTTGLTSRSVFPINTCFKVLATGLFHCTSLGQGRKDSTH